MSNDESLRQQTQEQVRNNPHTEKVTPSQVSDDHDRNVINNEIDRVRREQEQRR